MPPPPRIKSNTASKRLQSDVTVRPSPPGPAPQPTEILRLPFTVRTDGSSTLVVASVRGSFSRAAAGATGVRRVVTSLRIDATAGVPGSGSLVRQSNFLGSPEESGTLGSPEENVEEVFNVALGSPEEAPLPMGAHTLSVEVEVIDTNPSPSAELHINAAAGGHHATIYAQENE